MQGPILLHQPRYEPWPLLQQTDSNSAQYLKLYVLRAHDLHLIFWCSRQICWKRHPLPRWSGRGSKFADRLVAGCYNFFTPKLSRKPQSRPADNNNHEWWLLFSKFGFNSLQAEACFGCSESLLLFALCHWDWWEPWYQLINSVEHTDYCLISQYIMRDQSEGTPKLKKSPKLCYCSLSPRGVIGI